MPEKILCIQLKRIGDVLMTTPAVRELRNRLSHAEIHFLTQPPCDQVYACNPYINRLIKVDAKPGVRKVIRLAKALRRERYTAIIDFQGQPNTALISRIIQAQKRIGFDIRGRSMFYTHALSPPEKTHYSADTKLYLLNGLGINTGHSKLDFFITEKERHAAQALLQSLRVIPSRPLISLSPVSRREYKVWPAEYFARVADHLVERYDAQILFLWGPGEYHFIKKVRDQMKRSALPKYEVPTLAETVGLLEQVDLHVGNDNGPMHFAIAAGTKTVAVFGRPLLKNWTPPDHPKHLAVEFDPGCKYHCVFPDCGLECLKGISPEHVIALIEQHLG